MGLYAYVLQLQGNGVSTVQKTYTQYEVNYYKKQLVQKFILIPTGIKMAVK
jgi:hypothetical protein